MATQPPPRQGRVPNPKNRADQKRSPRRAQPLQPMPPVLRPRPLLLRNSRNGVVRKWLLQPLPHRENHVSSRQNLSLLPRILNHCRGVLLLLPLHREEVLANPFVSKYKTTTRRTAPHRRRLRKNADVCSAQTAATMVCVCVCHSLAVFVSDF